MHLPTSNLWSAPRKHAFLVSVIAALSAVAAFAVTPRPVADMPIPTPSGKPINLKQYRGKVVLMAVFSKECAPCIQSIEILNRIQKDYGARGFQAVAALGDPNAGYLMSAFLQRYRPAFPMGYLNQDQIIRLGDFSKNQQHAYVPIFMFIDRKGTVRQQVSGDDPFFKDEEASTRKAIQDLLKP